MTVVALGLGGPCAKYLGGPFLYGARKNLPDPSMRKCCDSNMFRVHQYTNWCWCLNLIFKCTRGTSAVQTWHGLILCSLVKQFW